MFIRSVLALVFVFQIATLASAKADTIKKNQYLSNQTLTDSNKLYDSLFLKLNELQESMASVQNEINSYKTNWWIPLIPYLIAGIISLIVALFTIRANVISRSRIQWIQNLRDTMADYLSFSLSISEYNKQSENDKKLHISNIVRMRSKESKLKLLLNNKNEEAHSSLINAIDAYTTEMQNFDGSNQENVNILKDNCIKLTQALLKTEWEKAKKESIFISTQ